MRPIYQTMQPGCNNHNISERMYLSCVTGVSLDINIVHGMEICKDSSINFHK